MDKLDYTAISAISGFSAVCFIHVLKELIISLRSRKNYSNSDNSEGCNDKKKPNKNIYKFLFKQVVIFKFILLSFRVAVHVIVFFLTRNYKKTLCFLAGSLTSVICSILATIISMKSSGNLVKSSNRGLGTLYRRCVGISSGVVVLSLGINLMSIFLLTSILHIRSHSSGKPTENLLNTISFYSLGSLFVTILSRLSGGLFTNSFNIIMDSNLEETEEQKTMIENFNNYSQNIYELVHEIIALVSIQFCIYLIVMGNYTENETKVGSSLAYLTFPMLVLGYSMFVTVFFVNLFGLVMKNDTIKQVKRSYILTMLCSLIVVFALFPNFNRFFTPNSLEEVKYNRYINLGLVGLGLVSGTFIAISNQYFLSSYNAPGKSITLSLLSSLTGGIVNTLSYAKLLSAVPTVVVCASIFICLVFADFYGLLFVSMGFMCSMTVVVSGSVLYSLAFGSSHLAMCTDPDSDSEVLKTFMSLKSSWHKISSVTRPFLSTWSILMAIVLISHLYKKMHVPSSGYINPFILSSIFLGSLCPLIQAGLILRLSSGIANKTLKKSTYSQIINQIYIEDNMYKRRDHSEEDPDNYEKEEERQIDTLGLLPKNKSKDKKNNKSKDKSSKNNSKSQNKDNLESNENNNNNNNDNNTNNNNNDNNDNNVNYYIPEININNNTNNKDNSNNNNKENEKEDLIIEVESEREENYRSFRGGFKACLLREAGVDQESLLNAPLYCNSGRLSNEEEIMENLSSELYHNKKELRESELTDETNADNNQETSEENASEYRHKSRDYKILKNADNHYKMFHPKYHVKHFNLKKRSTVASGSLEDLKNNNVLNKNNEEVNEEVAENKEEEENKGDNLDKALRRSQNVQEEVRRSVRENYRRNSSCASTYRESESANIIKTVQASEVHTKEPPMDQNNDNYYQYNNNNNNNEEVFDPFGVLRKSAEIKIENNMGDQKIKKSKGKKSKDIKSKKLSKQSRNSDDNKLIQGNSENQSNKPYTTMTDDSSDSNSSNSENNDTLPLIQPKGNSSPLMQQKMMESRSSRPSVMSQERGSTSYNSGKIEENTEEERGLGYNISVQSSLLPPDVDISNRPRRPTPKSIDLSEVRDLEANIPESENTDLKEDKKENHKTIFKNTVIALLLSLIPLFVAMGIPILVGVFLGKNSLILMVLFSTISSTLLIQVLTFCSMSWEGALHLIMTKNLESKMGIRSSLGKSIDLETGHTCRRLGKIASSSISPVLNGLILGIPLMCLFLVDVFEKFSNENGFPRWSNYL